jgi:hypothetical protein
MKIFRWFKKHIILAIALLIALLLLITAGVVLVPKVTDQYNASGANGNKRDGTSPIIDTPSGAAVNKVIKNTNVASVVTTPASNEYWNSARLYAPTTYGMKDLPYDAIDDGLTSISVTLSDPAQYVAGDGIGLSMLFFTYENAEEAKAVYEPLAETGLEEGISYVQKDNLVVVVPYGAFDEADFFLGEYSKDIASGDVDNALWYFNADVFSKLYMEGQDASVKELYQKTMTGLGITPKTEWTLASTDGLSWGEQIDPKTGKTSTTARNLIGGSEIETWSIEDMAESPERTIADIIASGEYVAYNGDPEGDSNGTRIPHAAYAAEFMNINIEGKAVAGLGKEEPLLEGQTGNIVITPNEWLSYMREQTFAPAYYGFSSVKVTFNENETVGNITFVE